LNLGKLGLNDRILAVVGILAFVDLFLPWYTVSVKAVAGEPGFYGGSASANAWNGGVGFEAWFAMLLLLAVGVLVALPAFDKQVTVPGGYAAYGIAAAVATLLILLRWLTFPSVPSGFGVSAGAGFGLYVGIVLGLVGTFFAYRSFTAAGGSLSNIGAAFSSPASAGQVPQQTGYPAADPYGQQPTQPPYQAPQEPYQPPQGPSV
jgi:hypothetical protein